MRFTLTANNRMHRTPSTTTRNTGETEREGKESHKLINKEGTVAPSHTKEGLRERRWTLPQYKEKDRF